MRKRTINHLSDTLFWYIIYAFPFIAYLIYLIHTGSTTHYPFSNFFNDTLGMNFLTSTSNPIFTAFKDLFGNGGLLPLCSSDFYLGLLSWFPTVFLIHLVTDFLLFIPRYCHKLMDNFGGSNE